MARKSRTNHRSRRSTRKQRGGVITQLTNQQIDQIGNRLVTLKTRMNQMKTNMRNALNELENNVLGQNFDTFIEQDNNTFLTNQDERFRLLRINNTVVNNLNGMLDEICDMTNPVRQLIQQFNAIPTGLPGPGPGPNNNNNSNGNGNSGMNNDPTKLNQTGLPRMI